MCLAIAHLKVTRTSLQYIISFLDYKKIRMAYFIPKLFGFCSSACGSTQAQGIWFSNAETFKITLVMVWPLARFFVKLPELAQQHGSLGHLYIRARLQFREHSITCTWQYLTEKPSSPLNRRAHYSPNPGMKVLWTYNVLKGLTKPRNVTCYIVNNSVLYWKCQIMQMHKKMHPISFFLDYSQPSKACSLLLRKHSHWHTCPFIHTEYTDAPSGHFQLSCFR